MPNRIGPTDSRYYSRDFEVHPDARVNHAADYWQDVADRAGDRVDRGGSPALAALEYTGATVMQGFLKYTGLQDFETSVGKAAHVDEKVRAEQARHPSGLDGDVDSAMRRARLEAYGKATLHGAEFASTFVGGLGSNRLAKDGVGAIRHELPATRYRGIDVDEKTAQKILHEHGLESAEASYRRANGGPRHRIPLEKHVDHPGPRSNWISTSESRDVASSRMFAGRDGYVFKIQAPGGKDVDRYFRRKGRANPHPKELETAFDGKIESRYIEGVWPARDAEGSSRLGDFVKNPNFRPAKRWTIQTHRNPK